MTGEADEGDEADEAELGDADAGAADRPGSRLPWD